MKSFLLCPPATDLTLSTGPLDTVIQPMLASQDMNAALLIPFGCVPQKIEILVRVDVTWCWVLPNIGCRMAWGKGEDGSW